MKFKYNIYGRPFCFSACSFTKLCLTFLPARSLCAWDFPARILEWVDISFSRGSSPGIIKPTSPASSALAGGFFTTFHIKIYFWGLPWWCSG